MWADCPAGLLWEKTQHLGREAQTQHSPVLLQFDPKPSGEAGFLWGGSFLHIATLSHYFRLEPSPPCSQRENMKVRSACIRATGPHYWERLSHWVL